MRNLVIPLAALALTSPALAYDLSQKLSQPINRQGTYGGPNGAVSGRLNYAPGSGASAERTILYNPAAAGSSVNWSVNAGGASRNTYRVANGQPVSASSGSCAGGSCQRTGVNAKGVNTFSLQRGAQPGTGSVELCSTALGGCFQR